MTPFFLLWNLFDNLFNLLQMLHNDKYVISLFFILRQKAGIAGDTLPIVFSLRWSNKKCLCSPESGFHFHNNPLSLFGKPIQIFFINISIKNLDNKNQNTKSGQEVSLFSPKVVFTFTITPFLSLKTQRLFLFCWIIKNHRKGRGHQKVSRSDHR